MDYNKFFSLISSNKIARVYLFTGEETFVMREAVERLRKVILVPGLEDLNEIQLEGPRADSLIAACETLPVMSERRLVLVYDCALLKSGKSRDEEYEATGIAEYLDNLPSSVCLVFISPESDSRKKLSQKLSKLDAVVKFDILAEQELMKWIGNRVRSMGKIMETSVISSLIHRVGRSLTALDAELSKLGDYAMDRPAITVSDVESVVTVSPEYTVFQIADYLVRGQYEKAQIALKTLTDSGKSRLLVVALITRQFRQLMLASSMKDENVQKSERMKLLDISAYVLNRVDEQAAHFESKLLKDAYLKCIEADYSIKSGQVREDTALDRLMLSLALDLTHKI